MQTLSMFPVETVGLLFASFCVTDAEKSVGTFAGTAEQPSSQMMRRKRRSLLSQRKRRLFQQPT